MYGEKAEETEELKMDLQDIKNMYKQQVISDPFMTSTQSPAPTWNPTFSHFFLLQGRSC